MTDMRLLDTFLFYFPELRRAFTLAIEGFALISSIVVEIYDVELELSGLAEETGKTTILML